jgi:hypothetical protein
MTLIFYETNDIKVIIINIGILFIIPLVVGAMTILIII